MQKLVDDCIKQAGHCGTIGAHEAARQLYRAAGEIQRLSEKNALLERAAEDAAKQYLTEAVLPIGDVTF